LVQVSQAETTGPLPKEPFRLNRRHHVQAGPGWLTIFCHLSWINCCRFFRQSRFWQRIGSDYRRFFRLHPDHLQVIDLINRKDFDRRIKTLG